MLAHELNNFTMSEAMKFYEKLRSSFKVGNTLYFLFPMLLISNQL